MSGRWAMLAGLIPATMLTAALAACGSSGGAGDGVARISSSAAASSGTSGASAAPTAATDKDPAAQAAAYGKCMRSNGVPNFPDPEVDEADGGNVRIKMGAPKGADKKKVDAAMEKCRTLMPGGGKAGKPPTAEEQKQILAFVQCMRDHGVDLPDPDFSGGGITIQGGDGADTKGSSNGNVDPDSPVFKKAQDACRSLAPKGDAGPQTTQGGDQ